MTQDLIYTDTENRIDLDLISIDTSSINSEKIEKLNNLFNLFLYHSKIEKFENIVFKYILKLWRDEKKVLLLEKIMKVFIEKEKTQKSFVEMMIRFDEYLDKLIYFFESLNGCTDIENSIKELDNSLTSFYKIFNSTAEKIKNDYKNNYLTKVNRKYGSFLKFELICSITGIMGTVGLLGSIPLCFLTYFLGFLIFFSSLYLIIGTIGIKSLFINIQMGINPMNDKNILTCEQVIQEVTYEAPVIKDQEFSTMFRNLNLLVGDEERYLGSICLICHKGAEDPVVVQSPSKKINEINVCSVYCKQCITKWITTNRTDPQTKEPLSVDQIYGSENDLIFIKRRIHLERLNRESVQDSMSFIKNQSFVNFRSKNRFYC